MRRSAQPPTAAAAHRGRSLARRQSLPTKPDCLNPSEIAMRNPLATRLWRMPNNLHSPPEVLLDPALATTGVTCSPDQPTDSQREGIDRQLPSRAAAQPHVLNISGVYLGTQYQAARIDQDVALRPLTRFAPS